MTLRSVSRCGGVASSPSICWPMLSLMASICTNISSSICRMSIVSISLSTCASVGGVACAGEAANAETANAQVASAALSRIRRMRVIVRIIGAGSRFAADCCRSPV
jgi:hypothetical protein